MIRSRRRAFTLVELLVVISIITILMSMTTTAIIIVRARARTSECLNNQSQLALGVQSYESTNNELPGYIDTYGGQTVGTDDDQTVGWPALLFEHTENADLAAAWREGDYTVRAIPVLHCPAMGRVSPGSLCYVANCGYWDSTTGRAEHGVFADRAIAGSRPVLSDKIPDGSSNTLAFSENLQATLYTIPATPAPDSGNYVGNLGMVWVPAPGACGNANGTPTVKINSCLSTAVDNTVMSARPSSDHPGGANAMFLDKHGKLLSDSIDLSVYLEMIRTDDSAN